MAALTHAHPLNGPCIIAECGDESCIIVHTNEGVAYDGDGSCASHNGFCVLRVDPTLTGKDYVESLLHEWGHHRLKEWREDAVLELFEQVADILFQTEVRRRAGFN